MPRRKRPHGQREGVIRFPGRSSSDLDADGDPEIPPGLEKVLWRIVFGKPFKTLHEANAFMDELRSELIQLPFSSRVDPDSPASLIARA
jgi:hypothetical protein